MTPFTLATTMSTRKYDNEESKSKRRADAVIDISVPSDTPLDVSCEQKCLCSLAPLKERHQCYCATQATQ